MNIYDPSGFKTMMMTEIGGSSAVITIRQRSEGPVKTKTLYVEGEGPKLDIFGKSYSIKSSGNKSSNVLGVQIISGEAGIANVYGEGSMGTWHVKGPTLSADIGTALAWDPKASLYAKLSLVNTGGSVYIPLPFTTHKLELGAEIDLFSIGGGLDVNLRSNKKRVKVGFHYGIGVDLIIGIE